MTINSIWNYVNHAQRFALQVINIISNASADSTANCHNFVWFCTFILHWLQMQNLYDACANRLLWWLPKGMAVTCKRTSCILFLTLHHLLTFTTSSWQRCDCQPNTTQKLIYPYQIPGPRGFRREISDYVSSHYSYWKHPTLNSGQNHWTSTDQSTGYAVLRPTQTKRKRRKDQRMSGKDQRIFSLSLLLSLGRPLTTTCLAVTFIRRFYSPLEVHSHSLGESKSETCSYRIWTDFSQKVHENEKSLTQRGVQGICHCHCHWWSCV